MFNDRRFSRFRHKFLQRVRGSQLPDRYPFVHECLLLKFPLWRHNVVRASINRFLRFAPNLYGNDWLARVFCVGSSCVHFKRLLLSHEFLSLIQVYCDFFRSASPPPANQCLPYRLFLLFKLASFQLNFCLNKTDSYEVHVRRREMVPRVGNGSKMIVNSLLLGLFLVGSVGASSHEAATKNRGMHSLC